MSQTPSLLPQTVVHRPTCSEVPPPCFQLHRRPPNHPSARIRDRWCSERENVSRPCRCHHQLSCREFCSHSRSRKQQLCKTCRCLRTYGHHACSLGGQLLSLVSCPDQVVELSGCTCLQVLPFPYPLASLHPYLPHIVCILIY